MFRFEVFAGCLSVVCFFLFHHLDGLDRFDSFDTFDALDPFELRDGLNMFLIFFACVDTSGGGVYDCDGFEFFDDFHGLLRFDGVAGGLFRLMVSRSLCL